MGFEVLTVLQKSLLSKILCQVSCTKYCHFRGPATSVIRMGRMEAAGCPDIHFYQTTQNHISKDNMLHMNFTAGNYLHENCNDDEYQGSSHQHLRCLHRSLVMLQSASPKPRQGRWSTGSQPKFVPVLLHTPEKVHSSFN